MLPRGVGTGRLPLQLALSFMPKLSPVTIVHDPAGVGLVSGLRHARARQLRDKYEYWLRTTFGRSQAAGFMPKAGDSIDVEATRGSLIGTVGWTAREPKLIAEAVRLADKWRDLPQSIRGLVLAIAVDAKTEVHERILKDVMTEPDRARRGEMLAALSGVRDVDRQKAALALILEPKLDVRETIHNIRGGSTDANLAAAQHLGDNQAAILSGSRTTRPPRPRRDVGTIRPRGGAARCDRRLRTKTFGRCGGAAW
jgi:hypothetical protein